MFGFDPLSRNERAEADALHDYLDALNAGVLAPHGEIDSGLAATVSQVHRSGRPSAAPYGLKSQIWEDLMSTSTSVAVTPEGVATPVRRPSSGDGPFARLAQPLGRVSRVLPSINAYAAAAVLVVMVMIGGLGAYTLRPGSGSPSTGGSSMPAVIAQASPSAEETKDLMQDCYSQPAVDLKDVFAIVNSAVFQTPLVRGAEGEQGEPVRKPTFVGNLPADTPVGTDADAATREAVIDAYLGFRLCSAQGINLQVLSLFTPAGIARLFVPGGDSIDFGTITSLLDPYAGDKNGLPYPNVDNLTDEIQSVQVLDDGRVVLALEPTDPNVAYSNYHYLIFVKDGDRWLIDDVAWTPVG